MIEGSNTGIDQKAKVEVLLHEYDTLRAEILSRTQSRFSVCGFTGASLAFVITQNQIGAWRWFLAVVAVLAIVAIWVNFGFLIRRCANRLVQVEDKVNQLAGEELLGWEHQCVRRAGERLFYRRPPS